MLSQLPDCKSEITEPNRTGTLGCNKNQNRARRQLLSKILDVGVMAVVEVGIFMLWCLNLWPEALLQSFNLTLF